MDFGNLVPWKRENSLAMPSRIDETSPFWALHRQIDRVFNDFLRGSNGSLALRDGWSIDWPSIDVEENEKEIQLHADLPGMEEKDIDVTFSDGVLTLTGEKKAESKGASYSERWQGQFSRSIHVGHEIDPDKVTASFKNGVLTVTMAKLPEAQSRVKRIAINGQS